jgi:hypothetical protein
VRLSLRTWSAHCQHTLGTHLLDFSSFLIFSRRLYPSTTGSCTTIIERNVSFNLTQRRMSFGYGVGDFIAGANLTYRLIRALSASQGASIEYQEAMFELRAIQQVFLQVSQMRASSILSQATINAASHIIISSLEIIGRFLDKSQKYQRRLSGGDSWCKIGWALFKKDELKGLRDSLHVKLSAVNLLLSSARLFVFSLLCSLLITVEILPWLTSAAVLLL